MTAETNQTVDLAAIRHDVERHQAHYIDLLRQGLKASCTELASFQAWMAEEMTRIGLVVDHFVVDPAELLEQPAQRKTLRENPSALNRGPNVVGRLAGAGLGRGILLFGHADKPPLTFEWAKLYPGLLEDGNRLQGPGIADDVAGLVSMLAAVETYRRLGLKPSGDLLVASVLGKQLGLFGTYGLVRRYGPLAAALYAHPAESGNGLGDLKIASLGMVEFQIEIEGKTPDTTEPHHTIYSRTAVSAVEKGIYLAAGLQAWASGLSQDPRYRHAELETLTGQATALSIGQFLGGIDNPVYHIPTRCLLRGAVNFPPGVSLDEMKSGLTKAFDLLVRQDPWLSQAHAGMEWGDVIGESWQSGENSEFLRTARQAIQDVTGKQPRYQYGHSLSDLRYPGLWWQAQAVGLGPLAGDMGTPTEWVDRKEYLETIVTVAEILRHSV